MGLKRVCKSTLCWKTGRKYSTYVESIDFLFSDINHSNRNTVDQENIDGKERTIENVEDPDHSFTKKDFLRVISSMWQTDHRRFMPGLLKAIITLALQLYLFTGARIGAFIPEHEDRHERGLRYKVKFTRSWDCLSLIYVQAHCSRIVSFRYDTLEARLESRPSMAQRQSEPRLHSVGHLTNLL